MFLAVNSEQRKMFSEDSYSVFVSSVECMQDAFDRTRRFYQLSEYVCG